MKLTDLQEAYQPPEDIQKYIDQWIEANLPSKELEDYLQYAPPQKYKQVVYRVLFGKKAVEQWASYRRNEHITLRGPSACSQSLEGMRDGVLEPAGHLGERCILQIHLHQGRSYGRPLEHSDKEHGENEQDEFLIKKNASFTLFNSFKTGKYPKVFGDYVEDDDTMVYVLI